MNEYLKILVVDDEFIMRQGIAHMIDWEQEGFQIIGQASNGLEALELIKQNVPDIIISDVVMPQLNGIELAKVIQNNYPQIKIIILSSYSDFEYVKSSFQSGAVDYILKPSLNPTEMLKTLKKISIQNIINDEESDTNLNTNNMINRLILGFDANIDYDHLNNLFTHSSFCLFGLNAKKIYDNYEKRSEIIKFTLNEISNEFSDDENNQNYGIQMANIENEILVVVVNFNNETYTSLLQKLTNISEEVSKSFKEAFFVLSQNFDSINNIKDKYENDFLFLNKAIFLS